MEGTALQNVNILISRKGAVNKWKKITKENNPVIEMKLTDWCF